MGDAVGVVVDAEWDRASGVICCAVGLVVGVFTATEVGVMGIAGLVRAGAVGVMAEPAPQPVKMSEDRIRRSTWCRSTSASIRLFPLPPAHALP